LKAIAFVDFSYNREEERAERRKFEEARTNVKQYYIGSVPATDGRWETWAQNTATAPYPIEYELNQISELFATHYLPNIDPVALQSRVTNLIKVIPQYATTLDKGES